LIGRVHQFFRIRFRSGKKTGSKEIIVKDECSKKLNYYMLVPVNKVNIVKLIYRAVKYFTIFSMFGTNRLTWRNDKN